MSIEASADQWPWKPGAIMTMLSSLPRLLTKVSKNASMTIAQPVFYSRWCSGSFTETCWHLTFQLMTPTAFQNTQKFCICTAFTRFFTLYNSIAYMYRKFVQLIQYEIEAFLLDELYMYTNVGLLFDVIICGSQQTTATCQTQNRLLNQPALTTWHCF